MISIGILTYSAPNTLENTLTTYRRSGLLELTDDLFVVINYSTLQSEEEAVCKKFNLRYISLQTNTLMAGGFRTIFENAKYETILFLENDFMIGRAVSKETTASFINQSILFLNAGYDIVRGRRRDNAGYPNHAHINLPSLPNESMADHEHLSETMYWMTDPEQMFPDKITRIQGINPDEKWYTTSSYSCAYTNNPYMCTKDFFRKAILPYLPMVGHIEDTIIPHWRGGNHKCVFGPGLFTHNDINKYASLAQE